MNLSLAPPALRFSVALEPSHLLRARERLRDYLRLVCADEELAEDVVLCLEEACTNVIRHSGALDEMQIVLYLEGDDLVATVTDRGQGFDTSSFDPLVVPDPMGCGGRGLFIIARIMDEMSLHADAGLRVRMVKRAVRRREDEGCRGEHTGGDPAVEGVGREARLWALLEDLDEGFYALDWEYRYVYVNRAGLQLLAKSRDELLGRTWRELWPKIVGTEFDRRCREAMELGRPSVFEWRSLATGDWLEVRVLPTPTGITVYGRKINERKAREEERERLISDLRVQRAELEARAGEMARRAELAEALDAIHRLMYSTPDINDVMEEALQLAVEAVGVDAGAVEFRQAGMWVVRHQYGFPDDVVGACATDEERPNAARASRRMEPFAIVDMAADPVLNVGFVRAQGLRSALGVRLAPRGDAIGCLLLYGRTPREFTAAELDFGRKLGAGIALALENAGLDAAQRRIATALQERFLHSVPEVAGVELGAVWRAACEPERVGGDFSDVFELADGRVALVVGDVAGKGIQATGLSETVRSTVRAFAAAEPSPASILTRTNDLLLHHHHDWSPVTALVAVLDPCTGETRYASAGHPAPVHMSSGRCGVVEVEYGFPLNSFPKRYAEGSLTLLGDDCLLLYTDGVTEARREEQEFGEERLVLLAERLRERSAQAIADGVCAAALEYADRLRDDLQIVCVRLASS